MNDKNQVRWSELLNEAVNKPGFISKAYSKFYNYSFGNQVLALSQCQLRGIEPGPIATYKRWEQLGRHVNKGQKAIELCMPVTAKKKIKRPNPVTGVEEEVEVANRFFIFKKNWFVLGQTDGEEYQPEPVPNFDIEKALSALGIERIPFDQLNGNVQGYALKNKIALNPLADNATETLFHELGHIVLGHTTETFSSGITSRDIRELEAESVSYLLTDALGIATEKSHAESRGYIQGWFKSKEVPEKNAIRIFGAVDKILKAGTAEVKETENQAAFAA